MFKSWTKNAWVDGGVRIGCCSRFSERKGVVDCLPWNRGGGGQETVSHRSKTSLDVKEGIGRLVDLLLSPGTGAIPANGAKRDQNERNKKESMERGERRKRESKKGEEQWLRFLSRNERTRMNHQQGASLSFCSFVLHASIQNDTLLSSCGARGPQQKRKKIVRKGAR